MAKKELQTLVLEQKILNRIYVVRGEKIMLDRDLAELYGIETKVLKQAVKRNIERFPKDFMFEMTVTEFKKWRENTILSVADKQGLRHAPFCFTEQGVTMLSCVLNSKTAIEVNIRIIRVFVKMREYALTHKEILMQLAKLEKEVSSNSRSNDKNSKDIENIFMVLKELIEKQSSPSPGNKIGFKHYD
ncbi:MAG: ORF6N domain-containing protein [Chitinophagaceae bacterium]|nr:ORF6N domain-containing protein [Chitinophagaceae bacterium]